MGAEGPSEAYISLSGPINLETAERAIAVGLQAKDVGVERFVLCIASLGGHFGRGLSIGTTLAAMPFRFVTFNVGMVESAAVGLFMCGEERYAVAQGSFLLHPGTAGTVEGATPRDLASLSQNLLRSDEREAQLVARQTGRPVKEIRNLVQESRQLNAKEARDLGIIQEIRSLEIPPGAMTMAV